MKILYLDLVGGISGDMTVAALVDLGVPLDVLRQALAAVPLPEVTLETRRELRHQIAGTRLLVKHRDGAQPDGGGATPAQRAVERLAGISTVHRPYRHIRALLERSTLAAPVKDMAQRVFRLLAETEGLVHGVPTDDVELHEVGAWDAIADIVCTAAGIAHLAPDAVYCSPVPLGAGQTRAAHGVVPVPGPATLRLLHGFPVSHGGVPAFERTTPTGAAILAALAQPAPQPFAYTPERQGVGVGSKDPPEIPNLLRAVLGRTESAASVPAGITQETIELAAANLDDSNPEWIGYAMERLLAAGALDVTLIAQQMKKNRPGTQIQVLYRPELRNTLLPILLSEVTTLGVRFQSWQRWAVPRRAHTVRTQWGEVAGKLAEVDGRARFTPEFEACRAIAQQHSVPLPEVYRAAQRAWEDEK